MKKTLSTLLMLALGLGIARAEVDKETRQTQSFAAIEVSKGANVTLIQCDKEELEVITDGCPLSDVETVVKKGTLVVKMKKRTAGSAVQVHVYLKDINALDVKSGASAETGCIFIHKGTFELTVGSRSEAEMEIETDDLIVSGTSCDIELNGKAKTQTVSITGTLGEAKYDALGLKSETIDYSATNTEGKVWFTESLVANIKTGELKYKGDETKVTKSTMLGGTVEAYK